jgi:hypothetical protein
MSREDERFYSELSAFMARNRLVYFRATFLGEKFHVVDMATAGPAISAQGAEEER